MDFVPKISASPKPGSALLIKKEPRIEVGAEIFRRFVLISELGHGRCSTSWLVEDPRFRRDAVLKLFRSSNTVENDEERSVWRDFLRRLRILNHPDIVITMEFFHEGSWLALSSTYENGPTLAALTQKVNKKLTPAKVQTVLKTVGLALSAAHDKCQIVHGNLNAFNILVPIRRSSAKITDFGFHPPLPQGDVDIHDAELSWKLACLSPERLQGGSPSHADDIYAFGVVAFQLFAGKNPPLDSAGLVDKSAAAKLLGDTPEAWRKQVLIALSADPEDRPELLSLILQELGIYEEFNPLLKELERAQDQSATRKTKNPRPSKSPDSKPKSTLFIRILTAVCVIVAPAAVGWIIWRNWTVQHAMQAERFNAEVKERAVEAEETAHVMQLNNRLDSDFSPSRSNLELYRKTMSETAATPKPTPLVVNSGARDFYQEGQAKFASGDPAGAMESYELAIVLQPDWPELLEARGTALLANKRPDDAILEYSKALIIEPTRVTSLIGRAKAHLASDEKPDAAKDLQTALKLDAENIEIKALIDKNNLSIHSETGVIR